MKQKELLIGFIGQGYVGKNYADDFERRGYRVVRYAKEDPHFKNKEKIKECDIVFVAVPTPTTPKGFNDKIIHQVIPLIGRGKIVVIKSTVLPGITRKIQKKWPDYIILHSPEFLSVKTASYEASHPFANIIGIPVDSGMHKKSAKLVHSILPSSPFSKTVSSEEAELIKYTHNCSGYVQIVFFNLMYTLAEKMGANWENIEEAIKADPYISNRYAHPVHKNGRGAGGGCFIKDFSALAGIYQKKAKDVLGSEMFKAVEKKNIKLLIDSKKDLKLLNDVYGFLEK